MLHSEEKSQKQHFRKYSLVRETVFMSRLLYEGKGTLFLNELTDIFRFEDDFPDGPHELLSMSSRAIPGALFQASMKQPWQK
jgi:hypothetical protein